MTTATADDLTSPDTTEGRTSLTASVRRLATRAAQADADRALRLAGPVLLPTGAIVVLLGWYGAANTTRVFLQIPYLISGGLLGLGMMFTGGFLYFARWMTDLLDESRRQADRAERTAARTADALERIERLLRDQGIVVPTAPTPSGPTATVAGGEARPPDAASGLVATSKGTMAHRPDCRLVAGRETRPATLDGGFGRCQICRPPLR